MPFSGQGQSTPAARRSLPAHAPMLVGISLVAAAVFLSLPAIASSGAVSAGDPTMGRGPGAGVWAWWLIPVVLLVGGAIAFFIWRRRA